MNSYSESAVQGKTNINIQSLLRLIEEGEQHLRSNTATRGNVLLQGERNILYSAWHSEDFAH